MKFNKSLLIAALSLLAASGLFAKDKAKKEEVPGVAPQPAEFFYTGKPYDADLGAYTFNFRNYDPELKRWTTVDPSGFPDGANSYGYINNAASFYLDPDGLSRTYTQTQVYTICFSATDTGPGLYTLSTPNVTITTGSGGGLGFHSCSCPNRLPESLYLGRHNPKPIIYDYYELRKKSELFPQENF